LNHAGGKLLLDRHVDRIESRTDGTFAVSVKHGDSHETFEADAVIATTPLPELVGMIGGAPEPVTRAVGGMRYIANFLIGIQITGGRISDAQWLYFPGEDTLFNRGYEPRNFHGSMTPDEDKSLIVLEVTCHKDDANWNLSDDALTSACIDGLVSTGLASRDRCTPGFVHRIPGTYPLYDLEYRERMDAVLGWLREFPRLVVTGRQGLFLHNNMDHSMHMGFRAAESLAEARPSSAHYEEIRRFQQFRIVD
jgi:protoporphyrinogen oxidase